jgi:AcrR family transcriptional regulator
MSTLTRKQREMAEREAGILEVARRLLASEGYIKLNMDRIAEAMEYSKGTIYHHFRSKEDIIVALDIQAHETMVTLFRMAASWEGRPRHRMAAAGVASVLKNRLHPDHPQIEQITCNPAILEKATEMRQVQLRQAEGACMSLLAEIVGDALKIRDLSLPHEVSPEDLVFGLWAMSSGAYGIIDAGIPLVEKGVTQPLAALWHNFNMLLDGYGWRPSSHEEDYSEVRRRAWQQLFAPHYAEHEPDWVGSAPAGP